MANNQKITLDGKIYTSTRKINGKKFVIVSRSPTNVKAEQIAKRWRNKGYYARVIENPREWIVAVRKKM